MIIIMIIIMDQIHDLVSQDAGPEKPLMTGTYYSWFQSPQRANHIMSYPQSPGKRTLQQPSVSSSVCPAPA
jgi:hypothetical protein